jgi:hypothetical protein
MVRQGEYDLLIYGGPSIKVRKEVNEIGLPFSHNVFKNLEAK